MTTEQNSIGVPYRAHKPYPVTVSIGRLKERMTVYGANEAEALAIARMTFASSLVDRIKAEVEK